MQRVVPDRGPDLRAKALHALGEDVPARLLTDKQRAQLLSLSTKVTYKPKQIVYHAHSPVSAIFVCQSGAAKAFRELRSGRRRVVAFLFAGDLFGLGEDGRYLNTVQALNEMTCYRLPFEPLRALLKQDAELQFNVLAKVVHAVRELQLRTILMGRRSAVGRVTMFLRMLDKHLGGSPDGVLSAPMSRTDVADYLGITLESVSRATRHLVSSKVIAFAGVRTIRILDREELDRLAAEVNDKFDQSNRPAAHSPIVGPCPTSTTSRSVWHRSALASIASTAICSAVRSARASSRNSSARCARLLISRPRSSVVSGDPTSWYGPCPSTSMSTCSGRRAGCNRRSAGRFG
jgi:CRP-like cAMP-binding protein